MTYQIQKSYDLYRGIQLYNCKIKYYPDGKRNIIYSSIPIFHPEIEKKDKDEKEKGILYDVDDNSESSEPREDSPFRDDVLKRNREKVFDIVYCNDWSYFLTITFNPKQVDFTNVNEVMKKLEQWLKHMVQRKGLKYILIPEKFKKTDGIHCHALINDVLTLEDSGYYRINKRTLSKDYCNQNHIQYTDKDKIYNVTDWKYGFSTAIPVSDNSGKLSVYLTKYITKGVDRIFGRYYWSSRNIVRDCYTEYCNVPYDEIELQEFNVPGTGYRLKYRQEMEYTVE